VDRPATPNLVRASIGLSHLAIVALVVVVAVASTTTGTQTILPIGGYHGAEPVVRGLGLAIGVAGGLAVALVTRERLTRLGMTATALAATSVFAVVPLQVDQMSHLLSTYRSMSGDRAERSGAYWVPSIHGRVDVIDKLRDTIPANDSYVLYGNQLYEIWMHAWLLPRVASDDPGQADWVIFHYRDPEKSPIPVRSVRRVGEGTWLAKVNR
jgi:hypothetical protein